MLDQEKVFIPLWRKAHQPRSSRVLSRADAILTPVCKINVPSEKDEEEARFYAAPNAPIPSLDYTDADTTGVGFLKIYYAYVGIIERLFGREHVSYRCISCLISYGTMI